MKNTLSNIVELRTSLVTWSGDGWKVWASSQENPNYLRFQ